MFLFDDEDARIQSFSQVGGFVLHSVDQLLQGAREATRCRMRMRLDGGKRSKVI